MYKTIWKFTVIPENQKSFEEAYRSGGAWADLFRQAQGYIGTELLHDYNDTLIYFTIDTWKSVSDYENFKIRCRVQYEKMDQLYEKFTEAEAHMGSFTVL